VNSSAFVEQNYASLHHDQGLGQGRKSNASPEAEAEREGAGERKKFENYLTLFFARLRTFFVGRVKSSTETVVANI